MASKYVKFSSNWKVEWSEFRLLPSKDIEKYFVTSYKNVPLLWQFQFSTRHMGIAETAFGIRVWYLDGPAPEVKEFTLEIVLMKPDGSPTDLKQTYMISESTRLGNGWTWLKFAVRDRDAFQKAYGVSNSQPLEFMFTLKLPVSAFMEDPFSSTPESCRDFFHAMFQDIEDPEKSMDWNVKLISQDGKAFYCHRVLLVRQSKVLAAMFHYQPITSGKPYPFPALDGDTLKAFLEFIYTGQTKLIDLSTAAIMELVDAAEQYDFQRLKEACASALWKRVVEKPEFCFCVIRFADLMDGLKYLKHRAMDVLVENWREFTKEIPTDELRNRFGIGDEGERLREEYDFVFAQTFGCSYLNRNADQMDIFVIY